MESPKRKRRKLIKLNWDLKLNLCIECEQNGNEITKNMKYEGEDIGRWLNQQKKDFKNKKLSKERKEKLEQLNCWKYWCQKRKLRQLRWEYNFVLCLQYEQNGNRLAMNVKYRNENIGIWLNQQKKHFKKNKLSEERKNKLKQLNYWKKWCKKKILSWDEMFSLCLEYEQNGSHITQRTNYKDLNIGSWLHNQKTNYNKNKLSEERMKKMCKLNYWNDWINKKIWWDKKISLCLEYENLGYKISKKTKYKGVNIGTWINRQKINYKNQKLSEERQNKLNQLKYWNEWLIKPNKPTQKIQKHKMNWNDKLELCLHFEKNGNRINSRSKYNGQNIGSWIVTQKTNYIKNQLSDERKKQLNQLKYWRDWIQYSNEHKNTILTWYDIFDLCSEYEKNGNQLSSMTHYKSINIGDWLLSQKRHYKKNRLSQKQKMKLNQLKYWRNWLQGKFVWIKI